MSKISKYQPTDQEVKGMFADTYNLFLQYKDVDCAIHENEINLACETIGGKYENCLMSATLINAVLSVLIRRSESFQGLLKTGGDKVG